MPTLLLHYHQVLLVAVFYFWIQVSLSPWLSPKLSKIYPTLSKRNKTNFDIHIVSFVQAVLVCSVAFYIMAFDEQRKGMTREERVFGYTTSLGTLQALGLGYFYWDLYVSTWHFNLFGAGTLFHAISALIVFSFGFVSATASRPFPFTTPMLTCVSQRPFVNYYGPTFILYELSTPFLNIHWFCDKLQLTGSTIQMINGILLIAVFIGCRLIWGTWKSIEVFYDIYVAYRDGASWAAADANTTSSPLDVAAARTDTLRYAGAREVPGWLFFLYVASNVILNGLNWWWINKMIATIRKRFDPPFGTRKPEKVETEADLARGVYADGTKSVEVDIKQVRRRPTVQRELTELPNS